MKRLIRFIKAGIWELDPDSYDPFRSRLLKVVKVVLITINDFIRDRCHVLASSLTYYTLLALVPLSAVIFVVLKHSGLQNTYGEAFLNNILLNPEISRGVIDYVNNTDLGALGVIGAFALIKIASFLLLNVEHYFNDIWGIRENRPILKKTIYYLMALILLPVLATIGLTVAIDFAGEHIPITRGILPYLITIFGFSFLYTVLPNARVKILSALAGGAVAGLLWHIAQGLLVFGTSRLTEFNLIYGSFSQIVLVFLWIYLSWLIILLGAETSFAFQNHRVYHRARRSNSISSSFKEKLALAAAAAVFRRFSETRTPVSAEEVIDMIGGAVKHVNRVLFELSELGFLRETLEKKERFFSPAPGADNFTVFEIINALRNKGGSDIPIKDSEAIKRVDSALKDIKLSERDAGSVLLSEL